MATGIGGEVAWWCPSLDSTQSGSTLTDLAGSNNVTLTNMALSGSSSNWVSDTESGGSVAIDLDGTNDYGDAGTSATFSPSPMSISLRLKMNASPAAFDGIFGRSSGSGWNDGFGLYWTSSTGIRFWLNSYSVNYASGSVADATTWNHIVGTWTTTQQPKIYANGTLGTSTGGGPTSQSGTSVQLSIGRLFSDTYNINGRLDDIRIFNRVITSGEISSLGSQRGYQPSSGFVPSLDSKMSSGGFQFMSGGLG